jgi:hypothetical protein
MLRNVANDIVYWFKCHHERPKKGTKYFLLFSSDDHPHIYHGYVFIKSNQCNIYVRRTYISLISTFRSTTRKSKITAVNCRHKLIRHSVTVYTHNNKFQVLRTDFTAWSWRKVPFYNWKKTSGDDDNGIPWLSGGYYYYYYYYHHHHHHHRYLLYAEYLRLYSWDKPCP